MTSGQIGLSGTAVVEGGIEAQTRQCLSNLADLLAGEGASLDAVVRTTVYLQDMGDFAVMNAIYAAAFGEHRPARATVGVAALPLGALVEIDAWAWVGT